MLVVEVVIDRMTQNESYGLLYYSIAGGDAIARNQIRQWRLKAERPLSSPILNPAITLRSDPPLRERSITGRTEGMS
jgi:hypothetical protein